MPASQTLLIGRFCGSGRESGRMREPQYFIQATHARSKEQASLVLAEGEEWQVGRHDGTVHARRWSISFDPALSRHHFNAQLQLGRLFVKAVKNRHPIHFGGGPLNEFLLEPGQRFVTAHTVFEFCQGNLEAATEDLRGTSNLLLFTAVLNTIVNGGQTFARAFAILGAHAPPELRLLVSRLEARVVREGEPLSRALGEFPGEFSEHYVAMIELGESTDLGRALARLFQQQAADYRRRLAMSVAQRNALAEACRYLAEVLEGGAREDKALALVAKVTTDPPVRAALEELQAQVAAGTSLSDCRYGPLFPDLLPGLLAAHRCVNNVAGAFRMLVQLVGDG